jgi:hypothetical protein
MSQSELIALVYKKVRMCEARQGCGGRGGAGLEGLAGAMLLELLELLELLDLRSYYCLYYWLSTTLSAKYSVSPKHCVGTPLC